MVFAGILSVQIGAGLAARMFSQLGPVGVTGLRLWWAAAIMAVLGGRSLASSLRTVASRRGWRDLGVAVTFGVVLAAMNFAFYQSISRIPLGVAVTIEFLGPLAVAVVSSRRLLDLVWVGLAAGGVVLLTDAGAALTTGRAAHAGGLAGLSTEQTGIAFALLAATGWAAYIVLSRATGRRFPGSSGLTVAMIVAAVVVTGPSVASAGSTLAHPAVIAEGLAVGLLSSVIPYRLELEALRRVPAGTFGIWMSVEPAVGALIGLALLSQALAWRQWLAIGLVIIACAGAARDADGGDSGGPAGRFWPAGTRRRAPPPPAA